MSKQANPAVIGGFVVGAVVLIAIGVMTFGGGELFKKTNVFVTYIDGSVKGLRVGSSVLFRGVQVGYVNEIQLIVEVDTLAFRTAVYLELIPSVVTRVRDGVRVGTSAGETFASIEDLIEVGLRAQLDTESYVTGQLVVQLDLHPEIPPVYRGVKVRYPEIPSIPSDIQRVLEKVQRFLADIKDKVDVDKLVGDLEGILEGANAIVNSPELKNSLSGLDELINSDDTQQLTQSMRTTLGELDRTLHETQVLLESANLKVGPALDELAPAVQDLRATLNDGRSLLTTAESQIGESSQLSYRLNRSLEEIEGAARALRIFLEELQRHPESLLKGKGGP